MGSYQLLEASALWAAECESENEKRVAVAAADILAAQIADTVAVAAGKIAPVPVPVFAVHWHASVRGRSALVPLGRSCWGGLWEGRAQGYQLLAADGSAQPGPCNCCCCYSCYPGKMLLDSGCY
jgi:hypothetical protein